MFHSNRLGKPGYKETRVHVTESHGEALFILETEANIQEYVVSQEASWTSMTNFTCYIPSLSSRKSPVQQCNFLLNNHSKPSNMLKNTP